MQARSRGRALCAYIRLCAANNRKASKLFLVLAAYCLLTIVFTYPIAFNISVAPAGIEHADRFEYVWTLWWAKKALIDLHSSPTNLTMLYYPHGAYHPLLLLDTCLIFSSLPLVLLFGPVVAYNLYFLASFVLTAFTTYLLCYFVTGRRWPSFLGGVIFAFVPFRSVHGAHGHLEILTTFWLPLYVLFLFNLFRKPGIRSALLCGLFLALSVLSTPLIAAHGVIPITILFLAYQYAWKRRRLFDIQLVRGLGIVVGMALALVVPFYYPMLSAMMQGRSLYITRMSAVSYSADLLSFVVPYQYQFVVSNIQPLQDFVLRVISKHLEIESVIYMGLVPLLLAFVGVWRMRSRVAFWATLAVVTGILALGPLLRIGGQLVQYTYRGTNSYVVLPGALLAKLPFYEWMRSPARFGMTTALAIGVLASCGVSTILERRVRSIAKLGVTSALVVLILLEYAVYFPFPVPEASVPAFYYTLAKDGQDYGLLDVTELAYNHRGMYYQTVHEHGIVRGHMHRIPHEAAGLIHFFEQLVNPQGEIFSYDFVEVLRQFRIRYVVLHKDWKTDVQLQRPFLAQYLGDSVYEDKHIVAFAVPPCDVEARTQIPLLLLGGNWHSIEGSADVPYRWMENDATIFVRAEHAGQYQLHFMVYPFNEPRHLEISVNEDSIARYYVEGTQALATPPFTLIAQEWVTIKFHVVEGCARPSEALKGSGDPRCLSMLFQNVSVSGS